MNEDDSNTSGFFLTDVSSYYLAFERLLFTAIGMLVVGYFSLTHLSGIWMKLGAFIVLAIAAIHIDKIINFITNGRKIELTGKDLRVLSRINQLEITIRNKSVLSEKYLSKRKKQNTTAFILLLLCFFVELIFANGAADYIAGSSIIQAGLDIMPTGITKKVTPHELYLIKTLHIVGVITFLVKLYAAFVLTYPFLKKSELISYVFNGRRVYGNFVVRALGTLILLIVAPVVIYTLIVIVSDTILEHGIYDSFLFDRNLMAYVAMFFSISLIKLIEDWINIFRR